MCAMWIYSSIRALCGCAAAEARKHTHIRMVRVCWQHLAGHLTKLCTDMNHINVNIMCNITHVIIYAGLSGDSFLDSRSNNPYINLWIFYFSSVVVLCCAPYRSVVWSIGQHCCISSASEWIAPAFGAHSPHATLSPASIKNGKKKLNYLFNIHWMNVGVCRPNDVAVQRTYLLENPWLV